ncbi:MAG: alpha/beta fold hydrolase [Aurantimonas endophytica]|uniref:alpha/beta hydrolase n=1 Tax=Aurantimonas endophytica TaxID=1522175 RepID=UPI0030019667
MQKRATRSTVSHLLVLAVVLLSAGCATRPGSEVLQVTEATVPGAQVVTVYAATTREREAPDSNVFTNRRAGEPNYASFTVSVPPNHQPGRVEWPTEGVDPRTTFATLSQSILTRESFFDRVAASPEAPRDVIVFVHGYNSNFPEALFRLTQMSADAQLEGAPVLFAWPSQAAVTGYVADKDSVTYSRDALADMLGELARDRRLGTVTVLAHSMGGWLTMEALRQLRLSGQDDVIDRLTVVLAAPDIDVDVFRAQIEVLGPLSPPLTVLVSPDDRALLVSNRLGGNRRRVGAIDIHDPRVRKAAREANVAIIDISNLEASDGLNHDRYVNLAALYSRESGENTGAPMQGIRRAGAFVFNTVGATISSPFNIVGEVLAGE